MYYKKPLHEYVECEPVGSATYGTCYTEDELDDMECGDRTQYICSMRYGDDCEWDRARNRCTRDRD